jgi:hypothetical protein
MVILDVNRRRTFPRRITISGRLASSSGARARVTRPHSCATTCWRCGSETKRERQAERAQATQKWGSLAMAIAEHPATPDPRIRTIVRSLIQEATSAVRPKMIAGRAWRPTWPSIDRRDAAVLEPRRRPGVALGARTPKKAGRALRSVVGHGWRPTPACCCAQYAIVEYWRCDALGRQNEFTAAFR